MTIFEDAVLSSKYEACVFLPIQIIFLFLSINFTSFPMGLSKDPSAIYNLSGQKKKKGPPHEKVGKSWFFFEYFLNGVLVGYRLFGFIFLLVLSVTCCIPHALRRVSNKVENVRCDSLFLLPLYTE